MLNIETLNSNNSEIQIMNYGNYLQAMNFPKSTVSGMPSCTKSVTLRLLDEVVKLKQDRIVAVNGQDVEELPVWIDGIYIRHASSVFVAGDLFIHFILQYGFYRSHSQWPSCLTDLIISVDFR